MKRFIALMVLILSLVITSCGNSSSNSAQNENEPERVEENINESVNTDETGANAVEDDSEILDENSNEDTVFSAQDVSDTSIESINTYGDYLIMYRMIIDDYFSNYESSVKDTPLYDEATFQALKDSME